MLVLFCAGASIYLTDKSTSIKSITMGSIEALARSESEDSKGVSVPYTADCPVYEVLYDSQGNPYFAATGEFTKGHGNTCTAGSSSCTPEPACLQL